MRRGRRTEENARARNWDTAARHRRAIHCEGGFSFVLRPSSFVRAVYWQNSRRSGLRGKHAQLSEQRDQADNGEDAIGFPSPADRSRPDYESPDILGRAREIGERILGPHAEETDQGAGPRRENFAALASAGLLGLSVPREFGGLDAPGSLQREVTEILASYCGVTTFTQAQHHGPCRMIAAAPSQTLKGRLLPEMASGRSLCAISFAHLRRPGPAVLRADPVPGGYRLTGTAPWVTGWGLMNQVAFGATLPDGRFVYLWSPANRDQFPELFEGLAPPDGDWGTLIPSPPLKLCAMNASATSELKLEGWYIPSEHWLAESNAETLARNDRNGVLGGTALPLGCTAGSLRALETVAERRGIPAASRALRSLSGEYEDARAQASDGIGRGADFFPQALRIRAWCIDLAVRTAHAAVTATSGSANSISNPAQRLFREAMFYTVQAQTRDVMDATLERLERR